MRARHLMASNASFAAANRRAEGWPFKAGALGVAMFIVAGNGVVGTVARAEGYLSRTGPVPLRFTVEKPTSPPIELPPLAMEDPAPAPTVETNTVAEAPTSPDTNQPEPDPATLAQPAPEQVGPPAPEVAASAPASDMLVVTPQMLVEYFKPGSASTNAANMPVYVPVGFTPPTAVIANRPSSQATYRTQ
jgi:hypothetical protein